MREFGAQDYSDLKAHIKTVFLPCIPIGPGPNSYLPIYIVNESVYFDGSEPAGVWLARLNTITYLPVSEIKRIEDDFIYALSPRELIISELVDSFRFDFSFSFSI